MSKRRINIQTFAGLSSPALDDEDVPIEGASFASGLDPTERPGRLRGFHEDEATGLGDSVVAHASIEGGETIIYYDGGAIKQVDNVEGGISGVNVSTLATVSSAQPPQMVSDGERVYMARGPSQTPLWIGEIRRVSVHGGTLPSGYVIEDAPLDPPTGHSVALLSLEGEGQNLPEGRLHQFAVSWTYDGFQEGPLTVLPQSFSSTGNKSASLRLNWFNGGAAPRRITHVNLYAIEGAASTESPLETGVPRLVLSKPVDSSSWKSPSSGGGLGIKGNPNWDRVSTVADQWYIDNGLYFAGTYDWPGDDPNQINTLSVSDLAVDDVDSITVTGSIYAGYTNTGSGTGEIRVRAMDGGTVLQESTSSLSTSDLTSADDRKNEDGRERTEQVEVTLSAYTASSLDAIEVRLWLESAGRFATIEVTVDEVQIEVGGGSGSGYVIDFDWQGSGGAPYSKRSGIAPTDEQPPIRYGANASIGNSHFVTGATVDGEDYGSYIFRSKAGRYSQFGWVQDYMNLDTEVHSLVSFNGRLWGFSTSAAYQINPKNLVIERAYEGKGAIGSTSITTSPIGLFWASADNLHLYDGRELRDVGDPIGASDDFPNVVWNACDTSVPPTTWYSPADNLLVVAFRSTSGSNEAWMLHFPEQQWTDAIPGPRWMHLDPPSGALHEAFLGADGVSYFSIGNGLYSFATAPTKRPWEWTSKKITAGEPSMKKVFYHADVKGDPPTLEYQEDEGTWTTGVVESTNEDRTRFPVNSNAGSPGPWKGVHHMRVRLTGAQGDEVSSLSLITRLRSQTR